MTVHSPQFVNHLSITGHPTRTSSSLKDRNPNSCEAASKSLRSQIVGGLLWDNVFLVWIVDANTNV